MNDQISRAVAQCLQTDIGSGDINSALLPAVLQATARIITREDAVVCGVAWVNEVFHQVDSKVELEWLVQEGEWASANQPLVNVFGLARSLLTAERVALNWLQTLSGTATVTRRYVDMLRAFQTKLLDTRKTIPGLRYAQKYAVKVGGGCNHRFGLFDAFLIKENHIMACGSIGAAIMQARNMHPEKTIEVEVESLTELSAALAAKADIVMLDNFSVTEMKQAVKLVSGQAKLEVSGNVTLENIQQIAATGVDFISVGALTKHLNAIDLSMRLLDSKINTN